MKVLFRLAAITLFVIVATPASATVTQDVQFRLINLERRIDQLQQRVDFLERSIQNKSTFPAVDTTVLTQSILETQRQQLVLAEQVVTMQKQMLEMQKKIDQLSEKKK
ncbi:MAG: hypothetical protein IPM66_08320 [Acidobacteriota bacterium]|nr:MAG: hypothetical protein IPM66_08320 [Acidobacteriota bacterium]